MVLIYISYRASRFIEVREEMHGMSFPSLTADLEREAMRRGFISLSLSHYFQVGLQPSRRELTWERGGEPPAGDEMLFSQHWYCFSRVSWEQERDVRCYISSSVRGVFEFLLFFSSLWGMDSESFPHASLSLAFLLWGMREKSLLSESYIAAWRPQSHCYSWHSFSSRHFFSQEITPSSSSSSSS